MKTTCHTISTSWSSIISVSTMPGHSKHFCKNVKRIVLYCYGKSTLKQIYFISVKNWGYKQNQKWNCTICHISDTIKIAIFLFCMCIFQGLMLGAVQSTSITSVNSQITLTAFGIAVEIHLIGIAVHRKFFIQWTYFTPNRVAVLHLDGVS